MKKFAITLLLQAGMLVLGTGIANASDIPASITSTLTITGDSQLVGDVTCTVTGAPCIAFGAPGITLNLNGFTMTGQGQRDSCPLAVSGENAIRTFGQNDVSIQGPGLVRRFRATGIVVDGTNSQVSNVVVASVCRNGIAVSGSGNQVVANTVVRASLEGSFFDGIAVLGSGGHSILRNDVVGESNPIASCTIFPCVVPANKGGHGIFVGSTNNLIEKNDASGNPGVGIFLGNGATGNIIRANKAVGNLVFQDIFDNNASGANTYANNVCDVSAGAGAPTCPN